MAASRPSGTGIAEQAELTVAQLDLEDVRRPPDVERGNAGVARDGEGLGT
jgi:hypothetical protein